MRHGRWLRVMPWPAVGLIVVGVLADACRGEEIVQLRNGMTLRGNYYETSTINKEAFSSGAGGNGSKRVAVIDDGLRRTYVHRLTKVVDRREVGELGRTVEIYQPKHDSGAAIAGLGEIFGASPFDEFGRREIFIRGPKGERQAVMQGITELNNRYAVVRALNDRPAYNWDMRIATSTLRSAALRDLFRNIFPQDDISERLKAVRFFIATERWGDAKAELRQIRNDFPDEPNLDAQIVTLTENQAMLLLEEARIRGEAGQHEFASGILERFPVNQISRIRRLEVSDAIQTAKQQNERIRATREQFRRHVGELPEAQANRIATIVDEINENLSANTIDRLSDYLRLGNEDSLPLESRVALAISGWLMGGGADLQNLQIAASLVQVRDLVVEYLRTGDANRRQEILQELEELEGSEPEYIAQMLPRIEPPLNYPEEAFDDRIAGMIRWSPDAQGTTPTPTIDYVVQLPPEYDPLRAYPCIVALHPWAGTTEQQLDWWSGTFDPDRGIRNGQGSRLGYVVIAPRWNRDRQTDYEYTAIEHHRVLASLRHAMRRVAIDADRVFIVGHGQGATAAWDIALSHPDLWAGLIAISGEPDKTIRHYDRNAIYVPKYFVFGEIDGGPPPLSRNGAVLDDYINPRGDSMIVEYRGRGREYFFEETPRLFEWMALPSHRRGPAPRQLELSTMRPQDSFFWWLELHDVKETVTVDPILWRDAGRAGKVEAKINADNQIRINHLPASGATIWLSSEMGVDLDQPISVSGKGRTTFQFDGSPQTMLEDVRTRGDRQRPFWVRQSL